MFCLCAHALHVYLEQSDIVECRRFVRYVHSVRPQIATVREIENIIWLHGTRRFPVKGLSAAYVTLYLFPIHAKDSKNTFRRSHLQTASA